MKQIEILAPAGSYEGLTAAVRASCDAVYIGGNKFGARAYADNPTEDSMLKAIDYAHLHNKKIYLTVNTLLKNSELENELYTYLSQYYEQGLDAVIVQDIGVMHFVHHYFPDLPIHASTQMTLTMAQGANTLKPMGITRLVNSRELSLEEIKRIKEDTDLEIESFIHGALCYCYSGQCFMSSMLGGRSGNRGRCAQPCRMPYKLCADNRMNSDDKYLLSPKDICTIDMIPDLIEAGIDSFKIEGRMKRPEYAAGVTLTYRKYVDKYLELGKERYEAFLFDHPGMLRSDQLLLQDLYNRGGFSSGYYSMRNGKTMMSIERPNHSGVYVGEVRKVKGNQAMIHLAEELNPQDILEIRDAADIMYDFTVKNQELKNSDYWINLHKDSKVNPGNSVYRTKNNNLLTDLSERFLKEEIKEPVQGVLTVKIGERLKLELNCRDIHVTLEGDIAEEAKNQPMSEDKLKKQMLKTNETSFAFEELSIILEGNVFVPVQKLNELRRSGLDALNSAIVGAHRRRAVKEYVKKANGYKQDYCESKKEDGILRPEIVVEIATEQQLVAACNHKEVTSIYLDSNIVPLSNLNTITKYIKLNNKKCYIVLPHIFRFATYQMFQKHKSKLLDDTIDGYILQNYEEYEFVTNVLTYKDVGKSIILNYNLYVMNYHAMKFWKEQGVTAFTAPIELNYQELKELRGMYQDIIVYGRLPLMVTAQCLGKTIIGDDGKSNQSNRGGKACCMADLKEMELIDRYQKKFPVRRNCRECYTTIYNSQSLSLLSNEQEILHIKPEKIRLNFTIESAEEVDRILNAFIQVYRYQQNQNEVVSEFTRGHFKRGVE